MHRELRLLAYNTFLMHIRLPSRSFGVDVMAAPDYRARAEEIGRAVAGEYDVAAFVEVFDEAEQRAVLAGWDRRALAHALGPAESWFPVPRKSSGLLTVLDGVPLARTECHIFRRRGVFWRDADVLGNKGVLLAEVDVGGPANLEVYSTHLIAGNDFLKRPGGRFGPNPFRHHQTDELLAFLERVHRPANVAIVVGDFNVAAGDPDYEQLRRAFDAAGFDDVWAIHGSGPGDTYCETPPRAIPCQPDPADPRYCAERDEPPAGVRAKRIDYAWLQRPTDDHRLTVSVRTVRRRPFPRDPSAEDHEAMPYLSDHVALHLELEIDAG